MTRTCFSAALAALALAAFAGPGAASPKAGGSSPIVAGWVETAWLGDPRITLRARLDTGAKSSSINAHTFTSFKRDGKTWVRFGMVNGTGMETQIEKPIVRTVRIRRAGVGVRERPVIELTVCVAGKTATTEFTLADRSAMNYQVLIGRNFLAHDILVDSSATFIASGRCGDRS